MDRFGKISEIDPGSETTWRGRVFLTLDIDWADDEVLAACIELVQQAGAAATWFVTHDTPLLARLRADPAFELALHPNFNPLLVPSEGPAPGPRPALEALRQLVPEATAVRSHSLVQGTGLMQLFAESGLTHDCNHYVPHQSGIALRPWRLWSGLVKVPHFWEDDLACAYGCGLPDGPALDGLQVYDFHPIHVFLNTETLERYERTRALHRDAPRLLAHRHAGEGTRRWLEKLLERA